MTVRRRFVYYGPPLRPEGGWCDLVGCGKPWVTHAAGEMRQHQRMIDNGHTELEPELEV